MPETRARDLANLAGAGATSSTVAYHETARGFTLPAGTGEANQVISSDGDGTTQWKTTLSAPEITTVTSDKGVNEYDSDGDDGAVIVINGTSLGNDASVLTAEISTDNFVTTVQTSTISILSNGTQIQATFNGTETNYNSINAGETVKVKVTKSGLQSVQSATLSGTVTGDPTFSTTSTTASTHTGTLAATSLGNYGGQIAGGGQDSNTKLLLNFDRTGETDIEDSSNSGGDGYKVTASGNAVIKASPFGDGKSAMFFDGSDDYINVPANADWDFSNTDVTFEFWMKTDDVTNVNVIMSSYHDTNNNIAFYTYQSKLFFEDKRSNSHSGRQYTSGADLKTNTWHHIAVVYDTSATTMAIYIDGKYSYTSGSSFSSLIDASSRALQFGGQSNASQYEYSGYLDEIRVVVGTAVYTGDFDVPTSRFSASDEANTKLLIHSNDDFTAIPKTQNSTTSSVGGWSTHGESGGSGNSVAVNGDSLRHTTGSAGAQVWTTRQITGLDQNKKYSASCKIEACSETPTVSLYIGDGDNSTRSSTFNGITGNLGDDTSGNAVGKRLATDAWSPPASGTVYMTVLTNQNLNNTCDINEWRIHNWDDASSSDHTITTTGSHHSSAHGGIAPAMTWPASLKKTGSAGVYFDSSNSDYLILGADTSGSTLLLDATTVGSIDFWMYAEQLGDYPLSQSSDLYKHTSLVSKGDIISGFKLTSDGGLLHHYWNSGHNVHCKTSANVVTANQWYHLCMAWDNNRISIFVDGVLKATSTTVTRFKVNTHTDAYGPRIGWHRTWSDGYFHGYIDNFRIVQGSLPMDTTGDPLHSSTAFSSMTSVDTTYFSKPTQIYGAYRSQDVGTIQLNATAGTGGGALDYAELDDGSGGLQSGQTALSTYGLSLNQSTGAITGTLTGLTNENSNKFYIRARANADDNRVTTLGGNTLYTNITQNDGKAPVLFNARRYVGDNDATSKILGYGFQPDLVWAKRRDTTKEHMLVDSVRGIGKFLEADTNDAENPNSAVVKSFESDGFRPGNSSIANSDGGKYVAWAWKAGGAPTATNTNTSGAMTANSVSVNGVLQGSNGVSSYTPSGSPSIYPKKMSVNTAGGFSIIQYAKNSTAGATLPHGLSQAPEMVIVKDLDGSNDWQVYHSSMGNTKYILLNDDANSSTGTSPHTRWYNTSPDSNVVTLDAGGHVNGPDGPNYIMYCFHSVSEVSAFGTYEGRTGGWASDPGGNNGGAIDVGFKPKFIITKNIDTDSTHWMLFDSFREASDTKNTSLYPNLENEENSHSDRSVTFDSAGFKFDSTANHSGVNTNGDTYIYMAFA